MQSASLASQIGRPIKKFKDTKSTSLIQLTSRNYLEKQMTIEFFNDYQLEFWSK